MNNKSTMNSNGLKLCDVPNKSSIQLPDRKSCPTRTIDKQDDGEKLPFLTLNGEIIDYVGKTREGELFLSNYRLFIQFLYKNIHFNIPLGLIDYVEVEDKVSLLITCKHAPIFRCSFATDQLCSNWRCHIITAITLQTLEDNLFAFDYFNFASEELKKDLALQVTKDSYSLAEQALKNEIARMEFDVESGRVWRISSINADHELCTTYPQYILTPASINDTILDRASEFRSHQRIPAVVWRNRENGAVIVRCSQPKVGLLGWGRSLDDEKLLKSITHACTLSNKESHPPRTIDEKEIIGYSGQSTSKRDSSSEKKLLILDARSYTTAVANRARGGGCEYTKYYNNCEIKFMNLPNIHSVQKSFDALRDLCNSPSDLPEWYGELESTFWLDYMSNLLTAASSVVFAIDREARPVLVHCSDGWDRTPQITSLSQLLLDPYYRTIEGFQVLVEREWLEFGHRFSDRCGGSPEDLTERSPVFLQWLDTIQNLIRQFPCAFEFSNSYLIKLALHTYSNLFGTFLYNSSAERFKHRLPERTFSIWTFLQSKKFRNCLYSSSQDQVLWPKCHVRYLDVWRELYLDLNANSKPRSVYSPRTSQYNKVSFAISSQNYAHSTLKSTMKDEQNDEDRRSNITGNIVNVSNASDVSVDENSIENSIGDNGYNETNNTDIMDNLCDNNDSNNTTRISSPGLKHDNTDGISTCTKDIVLEKSLDLTMNPNDAPTYSVQSKFQLDLDMIDGLEPLEDQVQARLRQMALERKANELSLCRKLHAAQLALLQKGHSDCDGDTSDVASVAVDHDDSKSSVSGTDGSWIAVEEPDATQWVPDHTVSHCTGCNSQFWLGWRKHHCRKCGKIYCADCSEKFVALPEEELFGAVRVCASCYNSFPHRSSEASTC